MADYVSNRSGPKPNNNTPKSRTFALPPSYLRTPGLATQPLPADSTGSPAKSALFLEFNAGALAFVGVGPEKPSFKSSSARAHPINRDAKLRSSVRQYLVTQSQLNILRSCSPFQEGIRAFATIEN